MTKDKKWGLSTTALHAGYSPVPMDMTPFRSFVPPVIQSAIYPLSDVDHYTRITHDIEPGYDYGRNSNPTVDVLQKRLDGCHAAPRPEPGGPRRVGTIDHAKDALFVG